MQREFGRFIILKIEIWQWGHKSKHCTHPCTSIVWDGIRCQFILMPPILAIQLGVYIYFMMHVFLMTLTQVSLPPGGIWTNLPSGLPYNYTIVSCHYKNIKKNMGKGRPTAVTQRWRSQIYSYVVNTTFSWLMTGVVATMEAWGNQKEHEQRNSCRCSTCTLLHTGHRARANAGWLIALPRQHLIRGPARKGA